jgi:hypothetical protein
MNIDKRKSREIVTSPDKSYTTAHTGILDTIAEAPILGRDTSKLHASRLQEKQQLADMGTRSPL